MQSNCSLKWRQNRHACVKCVIGSSALHEIFFCVFPGWPSADGYTKRELNTEVFRLLSTILPLWWIPTWFIWFAKAWFLSYSWALECISTQKCDHGFCSLWLDDVVNSFFKYTSNHVCFKTTKLFKGRSTHLNGHLHREKIFCVHKVIPDLNVYIFSATWWAICVIHVKEFSERYIQI